MSAGEGVFPSPDVSFSDECCLPFFQPSSHKCQKVNELRNHHRVTVNLNPNWWV